MMDYGKNKEPLYLNYWDVNNLYGWGIPKSFQNLILNGLKILLSLMKISQKSYVKKVKKVIFLRLMLNIPKN